MARVLILFAHPALEKSRAHRRLLQQLPKLPNLTFHDLYEEYPDFDINVLHEQKLLLEHDVIIWQHPFFWYSTPPLFKQWEDLVLEHGWAYGSEGNALKNKRLLSVITAGGGSAAYQHGGYNRFTIRELLAPIEQTAYLCKMEFLPPYVIHGTHRLSDAELDQAAQDYAQLLIALHNDQLPFDQLDHATIMNDQWQALLTTEAAT